MIIAARSSFVKHEDVQYVTDGLIAWWDGIWNVGIGAHDPNATMWKDLAGSRDLAVTEHGSWIANAFVTDGLGAAATYGESLPNGKTDWLEITLARPISGNSNNPVVLQLSERNGVLTLGCVFRGTAMYGSRQTGLTSGNLYRAFSGRNNDMSGLASRIWYCDGIKYKGRIMTASIPASGTISVGALSDGTRPKAATICCIRVYNRLLTAEEVAANYAVDKARFNLP